jgi:hypothetical protein
MALTENFTNDNTILGDFENDYHSHSDAEPSSVLAASRADRLARMGALADRLGAGKPEPEPVAGEARFAEFDASANTRKATMTNVTHLNGSEAVRYAVEATIALEKESGKGKVGPGRAAILTAYYGKFLSHGSWHVAGQNLDGTHANNPQFKPVEPRFKKAADGTETEKPIKYENLLGAEASPILPFETPEIRELAGSRFGLKLKDGEALYQALKEQPKVPMLVGEGYKTTASALCQGLPVVALRGVAMWRDQSLTSSNLPPRMTAALLQLVSPAIALALPRLWKKAEKPQLHPLLRELAAKGRTVYIGFDMDDRVESIFGVRRQALDLAKALREAGCKVKFLEWDGSQGKGLDDLLGGLEEGQRWDCLRGLLDNAVGAAAYRRPYEAAKRLLGRKRREAARGLADREKAAKWEPSLGDGLGTVYPVEGPFIGGALRDALDRVRVNERSAIMASAPTGTGKSVAAGLFTELAIGGGSQVVVIQPSEVLARSASRDLGIPYRKIAGGFAEIEKGSSFTTCIQAMRENCRNIAWATVLDSEKAPVVLIDEIDKCLAIAEADTEHQTILGEILQSAEVVVGLSAQVKQRHIKLINELSGIPPELTQVIKKDALAIDRKIRILTRKLQDQGAGEVGDSLAPVMMEIVARLKSGESITVLTAAQRGDSRTGAIALEKILLGRVPGLTVHRADAQSMRDPSAKAFRLGEQTPENIAHIWSTAQCVIGSSAIREGFSVPATAKVDHVFVIDNGSMTVEDMIQNAGRCRGAADVTIVATVNPAQQRYGGSTDAAEIAKLINANAGSAHAVAALRMTHPVARQANAAWLGYHAADAAQNNAGNADKALNLSRYFEGCGAIVTVAEIGAMFETGSSPINPEPKPLQQFATMLRSSFAAIADAYRTEIAEAEYISRKQQKVIQSSGVLPMEDYFRLKRREVTDIFHFDLDEIVNRRFSEAEPPRIEITPALIELSQERGTAAGWLRSAAVLDGDLWGCIASDTQGQRTDRERIIYAPHVAKLQSTQWLLLEALGVIELVRDLAVTVVEITAEDLEPISSDTDRQSFVRIVQSKCENKLFSMKDARITEIAEKIAATGLEKVCASLGVTIQPNKNESIGAAQVMTLIRQYFGAKTFYDSQRRINGVKGCQLIVFDDRAIALNQWINSGPQGFDVDSALAAWREAPRRDDYRGVWNVRRWSSLRELASMAGALFPHDQISTGNSAPVPPDGLAAALQRAEIQALKFMDSLDAPLEEAALQMALDL